MLLCIIRLTLILALFTVAACASITPAGLIAASRLDPLGASPQNIEIAVGVPEIIRLKSGDAVMRITFRAKADVTRALVEEEVPLQLSQVDKEIVSTNAPDEIVYIANLKSADAARFATAQANIRSARELGIEGIGSLAILIVGGCHTGEAINVLPVSTWLRTSPSDDFVPLTRRTDMFSILDRANIAQLRENLAPC